MDQSIVRIKYTLEGNWPDAFDSESTKTIGSVDLPRRPTHHANTEHRNDDSQARERLYVNGNDSCHRGDRDFGNDQRAKFDQLETFPRN